MIDTPQLLISDDDRDFRFTLQSVFEDIGFDTMLAANGAEAVEIVRQETVHVVLIDMHMPRKTGLEAIREIKLVSESIPCILLSGALDESIRGQATDAFSLLEKPVNFKTVRKTVSDALADIYGWDAEAS